MAVALLSFLGGVAFQMILQATSLQRMLMYASNQVLPNAIPPPERLCALWIKGEILREDFYRLMRFWGFDEQHTDLFVKSYLQSLTKTELFQLYWRGKIDKDTLKKKLEHIGIVDWAVDYLLELTKRIPPPSDLVMFELREVFRPEQRKVLLQPPPSEEFKKYMKMHGFDEYWAESYWASHWRIPPPTHLYRFLWYMNAGDFAKTEEEAKKTKKPLFNEELMERYLRYNDILPFFIPHYILTSYRPFTRVDTRRMYADGILTREEVEKEYMRLGYDPDHAKKLALWTVAYEEARKVRDWLRKGWISLEGAKQYLIKIGIPQERVEEWIKRWVYNPERTARERDLTKSEIIKGVKKGIIDIETAKKLLMNIGYEEWEAEYILLVHLMTGSPETEMEYIQLIVKLKQSEGVKVPDVPEELIQLEKQIRKLRKEIEEMRKEKRPEEEIAFKEKELKDLYRIFAKEKEQYLIKLRVYGIRI